MSKSRKRQVARKRGEQDLTGLSGLEGALPPTPAPETNGPFDRDMYERAVVTAVTIGEPVEEGERVSYLYNGDTLSLKYTEPTDTAGASLLVAAFRQGVVFQVRDEALVTYQPGPWEQALAALAESAEEADVDDDEPEPESESEPEPEPGPDAT